MSSGSDRVLPPHAASATSGAPRLRPAQQLRHAPGADGVTDGAARAGGRPDTGVDSVDWVVGAEGFVWLLGRWRAGGQRQSHVAAVAGRVKHVRSLFGFALSITVASTRNSYPLCSTTSLTSLRSVHAVPLRYVQVVDMGDLGPVRCGRCKAYMFASWPTTLATVFVSLRSVHDAPLCCV